MMQWRAWYMGGAVIDGTTRAEWAAAPDALLLGAAVLLGYEEHGLLLSRKCSGTDWYWWEDREGHDAGPQNGGGTHEETGKWVPCPVPEAMLPKRGAMTTDAKQEEVEAAMREYLKG